MLWYIDMLEFVKGFIIIFGYIQIVLLLLLLRLLRR